jgi:hypothetical protein
MDRRQVDGADRRRGIRMFGLGLVVVLGAGSLVASGPGDGRAGYGYGYEEPTPTTTATATATATASPTVTPPPPDKTAPRCRTRPARKQTARSIRRRGLVLNIRCNEAARHVTRVFVSRKQARKLGIKRKAKRRVLVGRHTTRVNANATKRIRVKLNKNARRGIRRMRRRQVRRLTLTIATSARDAAGNVRRATITRSFKR